MINWRIIAHPMNWVNVGVILAFWVAVAYLIAIGAHMSNQAAAASSGASGQ